MIGEYARCVADDATYRDLEQVLRFIENRSNWQRKLPPEKRLPDLPCSLRSKEMALAALGSLLSRVKPLFALPEPPARYLQRLRERVDLMPSA